MWVAGLRPRLFARGSRLRADELEELARFFAQATRAQALERAYALAAQGADVDHLLGAIFLTGLREVRPRPHGILHTVMMVDSVRELGARAAPHERWQLAYFNVADLMTALERDRDESGDFKLAPLSYAQPKSVDVARTQFIDALDAFDAERAEWSAVIFAKLAGADEFFELVYPYAARCYAFIGHKIIYAVQVESMLRHIGWQHAEPAVRSLVRTLLVDRDTETFAQASEQARSLEVRGTQRDYDVGYVAQLVRDLRRTDPGESLALVHGALADGGAPNEVWDALLVRGAQIFAARPGRRAADGRDALLPVHAFTVPNALRTASERARSPETERLLLFQAGAWIGALERDLERMVGLVEPDRPDEDPDGGTPRLDEVLRTGSVASAKRLIARKPSAASQLLSGLTQRLAQRGREHHQHKYLAACAQEIARVHPALVPQVLAPALDYIAHPRDERTELAARSAAQLERAGIR